MKRENSMPIRIGKKLLPSAQTLSVPLTEVADNRRVLIENHQGIALYGSCEICVNVTGGHNCIQGNQLQLHCISKDKVVITGQILCVKFVREV